MVKKKSSKRDRLDLVKGDVEDTYGDKHLESADERGSRSRIPTGSITGDLLTGGGHTVGSVHWFWGWESCGKTTQSLLSIKNSQNMCAECWTRIEPSIIVPDDDEDDKEWREKRYICKECNCLYHDDIDPPREVKDYLNEVPDGTKGKDLVCEKCGHVNSIEELGKNDEIDHHEGPPRCKCGENEPVLALFVDFEGDFDAKWAQAIGVDLEDTIIEKPDYGEQGLDIIDSVIEEGAIDIIVIDSIAHISPSEEIDTSLQKSNSYAGAARVINQWLRALPSKMSNAYRDHGTKQTVFAINQIRQDPNAWGKHVMFGGHGQKFKAATILKFNKNEENVEKKKVGAKTRKEHLSVTTHDLLHVRCEKNKTAPTKGSEGTIKLMTADWGVYSKGQINDYSLMWKYGRECEVISKKSGDWIIPGWPLKYKRQGDLIDDLRDKPYFKQHLSDQIVKVVQGNFDLVKEA